jgi:hypothetical protein
LQSKEAESMATDDTAIRSMRRRGMSFAEIALHTGLTVEQAAERVKQVWQAARARSKPVIADPNEYEIMLVASAIRLNWPPREEARRRGGNCDWTPPDADMDLCRQITAR